MKKIENNIFTQQISLTKSELNVPCLMQKHAKEVSFQ